MGKIGEWLGNQAGGWVGGQFGNSSVGSTIGGALGSLLPFSHGYNGVIEQKRTKVHTKKASAKKHKKAKK